MDFPGATSINSRRRMPMGSSTQKMSEAGVKRRLAVILAADVVGYGRLMQQDEAGTLAVLKVRRKDVLNPLVARHKGRVFKTTGDGVLIEFSSAVAALGCAVELQEGFAAANADLPAERQIVLRVGINLGEVLVEGGDLYGDGVNIAARLETLAEPGGICISRTMQEHVRGKVPYALEDMGPQALKNVAEPVGVYRLRAVGAAAAPAGIAPSAQPHRGISIAVLPFTNMSGDPEQEFFSDGITEDIITELSKFRILFVIARNTSFTYKGRAVNVRDIGRELGVRYVAEGSIRRAGGRVRVTAQLIDTATGHHIWAERYDRDLQDVFEVQDDVTRCIVTNIAPRLELEDLHGAHRRTPEDMRAYDHYLKAKVLVDTPVDIPDLEEARAYCDAAIALDPNYALAYAYKALSITIAKAMLDSGDIQEKMKIALYCAEKALALDPSDSKIHSVLAETTFHAKLYDRALVHSKRAIELNPNDADVLAASGYMQAGIGNPELSLRHLEMALERNPADPAWYHWMRGLTLSLLGRHEEALIDLDKYVVNVSAIRTRTYALAKLGRMDEAREEMTKLLAARPGLNVGRMLEVIDYLPNHRDMIDCFRTLGLPD